MLPLNSLIMVEYEEPAEKKTEAGLYVPPTTTTITAQDFLKEGTVLAVNPKEENIKVGDVVYFNIHAKTLVPGTKNQYFVRTEDLYGVK
jgi:co-chaperonin GroES (HSP10)